MIQVSPVSHGWAVIGRTDIFDPEYADLYRNPETEPHEKFMAEWRGKVLEVIDKYQPDVIWFDGGKFRGSKNEATTLEVLAHFHNTRSKKGSSVEVKNECSRLARGIWVWVALKLRKP